MQMRDLNTNGQPRPVVRLIAVIVIYKMHPLDSSTLQTLLDMTGDDISMDLDFKIHIWDNTPGGQSVGDLPNGILYTSAPNNPGLAQAYNETLELAQAMGYDWLLTLDQDSILPSNFLARITELARELSQVAEVGAIVPQVISDNRIISPFRFLFGGLPRWFNRGFVGISKNAAYAANSGTTLRVSALRQIGGYDVMFPLDLSDTNIFRRLQNSGKKVFIAGDLVINHNFALLNKQERMSVERYDASLLDDCAFWDMYMGPIARIERIIRFAGRACRDLCLSEESDFSRRTFLELKRRLFKPRRERIAEWTIWATLRHNRSAQVSEDPLLQVRTRFSQSPELGKH